MATQKVRASNQARMADAILHDRQDMSLKEFLADQRSQGATYESIAQELYAVTDRAVSVSYQTVKRWLEDFDIHEVAS